MKRRDFITLLGGAAAWPLRVGAQEPTAPVIGYLGLTTAESIAYTLVPFRKSLRLFLLQRGVRLWPNLAVTMFGQHGSYRGLNCRNPNQGRPRNKMGGLARL